MLDVERAFIEHGPLVRNWLRSHTNGLFSDEDIDDLTMATFERAVRSADRYQDRGHRVSTWLIRIAHNLLVDEVRRRRIVTWVPLEDAVALEADDTAARTDDLMALRSAFGTLYPRWRLLLAYRYEHRMTQAQAGARMGMSHEAAKHCDHRAIKRLRQVMGAR